MANGWHRRRTPKPTTTAAGYGTEHKRARARWLELLTQAGSLPCTRCPHPVLPGQAVHLDHDTTRTGYLGLAHARCNIRAGAKTANRTRNGGGYRAPWYPRTR